MKLILQKNQDNNKNIIGSVAAGVAGIVAIAGVAVATTIALKDKKTRKKVKNVLVNVKDQAMDYAEALKIELNAEEESPTIKKNVTYTKKVSKKGT